MMYLKPAFLKRKISTSFSDVGQVGKSTVCKSSLIYDPVLLFGKMPMLCIVELVTL